MSRSILARYLNPWKHRREQDSQRIAELRRRDGDDCARCRRPLRFDLPAGHDLAARVEEIRSGPAAAADPLENLCLCHGRCNSGAGDDTAEVRERVRLKAEAELFARARSQRRA